MFGLEANLLQETLPPVCIGVGLERKCLPFRAAKTNVDVIAVRNLLAFDMDGLEDLHVGRRLLCIIEVHRLPTCQTILYALDFGGIERRDREQRQATEQTKNRLASRHGNSFRRVQVDENFLSPSAFTGEWLNHRQTKYC